MKTGYIVCEFCGKRGKTLDMEPTPGWLQVRRDEPKDSGGILYEVFSVCTECADKPEPFELRCPLIDGHHDPLFISAVIADAKGRFVKFDLDETKFYCKDCGREAIAWRPKKPNTIGNQIDLTKTFRQVQLEKAKKPTTTRR